MGYHDHINTIIIIIIIVIISTSVSVNSIVTMILLRRVQHDRADGDGTTFQYRDDRRLGGNTIDGTLQMLIPPFLSNMRPPWPCTGHHWAVTFLGTVRTERPAPLPFLSSWTFQICPPH